MRNFSGRGDAVIFYSRWVGIETLLLKLSTIARDNTYRCVQQEMLHSLRAWVFMQILGDTNKKIRVTTTITTAHKCSCIKGSRSVLI